MDSAILHIAVRKSIELLYFGTRMVVSCSVALLLKRMRVYNGNPILYVSVHKQGNHTVVRHKQNGQEISKECSQSLFH